MKKLLVGRSPVDHHKESSTPIGTNKIDPGLTKSGFTKLGFKFKMSREVDLNRLAI